jgi:FAD/FMN-containing dehydrogenase
LTSEYGQGADNILEVEMVLPNGTTIIANECQNKDIFWAIRGGGGGTFGVITKITMKAYPMPQTTQWLWGVSQSNGTSASDWWKSVAELHSTLVGVNEKGFQGYYTIIKGAGGLMEMGGYLLAYDKSEDDITKTLEPFLRQVNSTNAIDFTRSITTRHDTWIEAYNSLPVQSSTDSSSGPGGVISVTRLLTKRGLTEDINASAKMFAAIGPQDDDERVCIR